MSDSMAFSIRSSYESGKFTNVTFILLDEEKRKVTLKAHKCVLASRSPTFERWFFKSVPRKQNRYSLDDDIKDFRPFLDYIYMDLMEPVTLVPIFKMAIKYEVKLDLADFRAALCCHNTSYLLELAREAGQEYQLYLDAIKEKIQLKSTKILSPTSPGLLRLSTPSLVDILNLPTLKITAQGLIAAVESWTQFQCGLNDLDATDENKRDILGNSLETSTALQSLLKKMEPKEFVSFCQARVCDNLISWNALTELRNKDTPPKLKANEVEFSIFIRCPTGKRRVLNVHGTTTVNAVKIAISKEIKIFVKDQRLIFQGRQLRDEQQLHVYGIHNESELQCCLRLRGC